MFSKLSVVVTSVLIVRVTLNTISCLNINLHSFQTLAAAIPTTTPPVTPPSSPQCCSSVQSSSSTAVSAVAALLGLDLSGLNVPIGLGCSPITLIGNNW
jgi:hypothetical protein